MKTGSIWMFDNIVRSLSNYSIKINNVERLNDKYLVTKGVYGYRIEIGDELDFTFVPKNTTFGKYQLIRRDYTIVNENDKGIKETIIDEVELSADGIIEFMGVVYDDPKSYRFEYFIRQVPYIPFDIGNGFNDFVFKITQHNDKIYVGGRFTEYNGVTSNKIIRLNIDGTVDNTFTIGTGFNQNVNDIVIQSDGKILVGGGFTEYNGTPVNGIIRLNTNGSIDNTFNGGIVDFVQGNIRTLQLLSDGKILVGYNFFLSLSNQYRVIRLNTNGSIDNTFNGGGGTIGFINEISVQSDGKIFVNGSFLSYNGISSLKRMIRLNSDGTVDNTFTIGTGFNTGTVQTINILSDGKILVGGNFTEYNGTNVGGICRLNIDGTIDNTFNIGGIGFIGGTVETIIIKSDGKILVGGGFTSYNGITYNAIIRLNTNGSIDNTFTIGTGFNFNIGGSPVKNTLMEYDDSVIVGGGFTSYNGVGYNRIIKLFKDGSVVPSS